MQKELEEHLTKLAEEQKAQLSAEYQQLFTHLTHTRTAYSRVLRATPLLPELQATIHGYLCEDFYEGERAQLLLQYHRRVLSVNIAFAQAGYPH